MAARRESWNCVSVPNGATVRELETATSLRPPDAYTWASFVALGQRGCRESLRVLESAAADADWTVRRAAIEAIGRHVLAHEMAQVVIRAFQDPNTSVRRAGCYAAAEGHIADAHDRVLTALRDPDDEVRRAAVEAIDSLWQPGDFSHLWPIHVSDTHMEVRRQAAFTLFNRIEPSTWEVAFARWISDPLPRHRAWACRLALRWGSPALTPVVQRLADDENGHVRKAAAAALAAWQHDPGSRP